jgi:HlyD family secretion protein
MAIENQIRQTQTAMARVENHLNRLLQLEKKQFVDKDTLDNQTKTLQELSFQAKQYQENLKLSKMGSREQQIKAQFAAYKSAKAKLRESKWYLSYKTISAPADGYVYDTFYNPGELVPAQKPVVVMVVPDYNYVEFFVSSKDVAQLSLGMPVKYQFYGDSNTHDAQIDYIAATVEYMPPVLYTPDYQEELVFRIRAKPKEKSHFILIHLHFQDSNRN